MAALSVPKASIRSADAKEFVIQRAINGDELATRGVERTRAVCYGICLQLRMNRQLPEHEWFGRARPAGVLVALLALGCSARSLASESDIHFNRDIRPIFADNCFACHGPDPGARKAGLRLDTNEGLYGRTAKHDPVVVPGKLEQSPLWQRISSRDPEEVMPPPKSRLTLKPEQIERVKQWILAGAPWQGHWAFVKPERPPVPELSADNFEVRNPIDAFVLAKLKARDLAPAPPADRRSLVRRLALDLTGLPPEPERVEAFVQDSSADAYEALVDQLLASPRWGEHRARYWLDAARYADTHGLHFDNYREIWPYRDWVINAFNRNMPFDRFTVEQLAGDLLDHPTDDQIVATGFHRCNITTNEGGTIEEENLVNYAHDRVTTTSWVWLGLTMNCASCHDHKFDPLTMRDFYSMAAFFRNTKQSGFDRNWRESDLYMVVPQTDRDRIRWKSLPAEIEAAQKSRAAQNDAAEAEFTAWISRAEPEERIATGQGGSIPLRGEHVRIALNEGVDSNLAIAVDGALTNFVSFQPTDAKRDAAAGGDDVGAVEWRPDGPFGPSAALKTNLTLALGDLADLDAREPFSFGAWVHIPEKTNNEASVFARMGGEPEHYRGWDLWIKDQDFGFNLVHRWPSVVLGARSTDKPLQPGQWQHLFITYDGSGRAAGAKVYLNGLEVKTNRDRDRLEGSIHSPFPLRVGGRERSHRLHGVAVQDVRIYRQCLTSNEVGALAAAPRLPELLTQARQSGEAASPARAALRDYFLVAHHAGWREANAKLASLQLEQQKIRGRSPVTLIQQEKTNSEPFAYILSRGQYDKPREKVGPATPSVLHPMPSNAPKNRLGLAQWLVSSENPITARVTVNRFWQEIFGVGLVRSADDFGVMGENPVHPELLDWLAVEFVESGYDVKRLFKLIVMSSTYRQDAAVTADKLSKDPQNRYLSRGPRFRMDAEMIRDYALATSGLLSERIGGPSVKPIQPAGVWEAVAMPESNTRFYTPDSGEALYRRSLYTFWKRAAPPAFMDTFNAPSREVCSVRRERTNTPLQALATLNDVLFIEAARKLAETTLARSGACFEDTLGLLAARLLGRPFDTEELSIVKDSHDAMLAFYRKNPQAAEQLVAAGEGRLASGLPLPELAALTMVVNQLMNLDEVLNK